jgi:acetyl-CoA carboxylase biotin carboxylase subunit
MMFRTKRDMFKKVLVANRGEIAVRIIRACRELGISPVAVYSQADRASLHVRLADEAYLIGPPPSSESYLAIGKIIDVAGCCGAEAIHPGYGFLAENPRFAKACADQGLVFVGPSADSMRLMGSKTGARSVLHKSGVPVVPGTYSALASVEEAMAEARRIGYPVMIKAAAGGGGKGMRLVPDESQMPLHFETASSEALNAFGDPSVYLEKYIARPRHIEIQILVDKYGNAVHLGERECSVQRRHQKVIEECPSPLLDATLRSRMGEAALRVARAANYENAGTVEFLADQERNFYFLEMNTRLQVEHPVTEAVTGVDIVREQFRIAAGERLSLRQENVHWRGWAMECRIYAEDPERNFFPSPGPLRELSEPQGPGIRVDSGVYRGWEVPIYYDPLIAKLVTFGSDRMQAVARMRRAIREYRVQGVKTNLQFFSEVLADPEFVAGRLSTKFIEDFFQRRPGGDRYADECMDAVVTAAVLAYSDSKERPRGGKGAVRSQSAWKFAARPGAGRPGHSWRS